MPAVFEKYGAKHILHMRSTPLAILFFISSLTGLPAQEKEILVGPRHQVRLSAGVGFDDGLFFSTRAPAIGVNYEYMLNKRVGLAAHLLSFYRTAKADGQAVSALGATAADLLFSGFWGPFITDEDLRQIESVGIKKITATHLLKYLSVPIDAGINIYPISSRRHRLGINLALALVFESNTHPSNQRSVELELENGTVYRNIFFSEHREYRRFVLGAGAKVFYEYHFPKSAIGLRAGNYNVFELSDFLSQGLPVWESSLYFMIKR